eukprot:205308-Hanusia_phi.AAC.1
MLLARSTLAGPHALWRSGGLNRSDPCILRSGSNRRRRERGDDDDEDEDARIEGSVDECSGSRNKDGEVEDGEEKGEVKCEEDGDE